MKGKKGKEERKIEETEKKGDRKKKDLEFQCGNRTRDLLIHSRHYHVH